jgi:hypothetical protein
MRRYLGLVIVVGLVGWRSAAFAADPPTEATAIATVATADPHADPSIDRAWFAGTALTQPEGTLAFNDLSLGYFGLVFLGVSYAITDSFQIGATVMPPIAEGVPFVGVAAAKWGTRVGGSVHLAAIGNAFLLGDAEGMPDWAATLGGVGSVCIDRGCSSLLSGFAVIGFTQGQSGHSTPLFYGASALLRLTRSIKLVVEADSATVLGDGTGIDGGLITYGVRFYGKELAADVGFAKPFQGMGDRDSFGLGLPVFSLTYRP